MDARTAGVKEVIHLASSVRIYSDYCIVALVSTFTDIAKFNKTLVFFSAAQIKFIRVLMYDKIRFWRAKNHRQVMDGVLLAFCYEPWKCVDEKMDEKAMCYFGHFGKQFVNVQQAKAHCQNCVLVLRGFDSTGDNLMEFPLHRVV